jgi:hypothetical protein
MLVMIFGPIALLFVPFPPIPLHVPQVEPQKTLQICALLLQVASLDDFSGVSDAGLWPNGMLDPRNVLLRTKSGGFLAASLGAFSPQFDRHERFSWPAIPPQTTF